MTSDVINEVIVRSEPRSPGGALLQRGRQPKLAIIKSDLMIESLRSFTSTSLSWLGLHCESTAQNACLESDVQGCSLLETTYALRNTGMLTRLQLLLSRRPAFSLRKSNPPSSTGNNRALIFPLRRGTIHKLLFKLTRSILEVFRFANPLQNGNQARSDRTPCASERQPLVSPSEPKMRGACTVLAGEGPRSFSSPSSSFVGGALSGSD